MKTLERRLTDTLRNEAKRLPDEEAAHTTVRSARPKRPAFLRPGLAAPAAVVAVMILATPLIWLSAERGGGGLTSVTPSTSEPTTADTSQPASTTTPATVPVFTGPLGSVIDQLPDGFDPERASPVFAMDGNVEETAGRYLETRLLFLEAGVTQVEKQDGYTLVQWAWGRLLDQSQTERGHSGWLLMRPTTRGFEIVAATTDGVDLSDLAITDGSLRGVIQSDTDEEMGVDVLNRDETPVASAPNPDGMPDADFRWGTAGAGIPPLALDLPVTEPVTIRVNRVGGTLVSISEVILGQGSDDPDGTDEENGPVEELVGEGEEPLAWGTAGDSPWVLVGWHLSEPNKPTQACTGVRPVFDEDWCTIPDGVMVYPQAFVVGDGGVIVLRTQPGVSQILVESELGSHVFEVYGEADGYPPTAVFATEGAPIAGRLTPLGERGEELSEPILFSFTEFIRTPAGG